MKKITLLAGTLLLAMAVNAQEDYNRWSIEAGANMTRAFKGYSNSSYNNAMEESLGGELTGRYMINDKFGFQLGGFFGELKPTDGSPDFKTEYYGAQIEAVANLGNILGFRTWTQRFNVLAHAGGGVSVINPVSNTVKMQNYPLYSGGKADLTPTLVAGLTPQVRLSNRVALFADVSFQANWKQDYAWDTNSKIGGRFIESGLATVSAGIQVYLGKNEKHADWANTAVTIAEFNNLDNRMEAIEAEQQALTQEVKNTQQAVADQATKAGVDSNNNGVDDAIEKYIDERLSTGEGATTSAKSLIDNGYVNVYFQFDSAEPETYSLQSINYLIKYMAENPSSKAELIGYADELGNAAYNNTLSEKRAKKVYDILLATGVDAGRLSYTGGGVDNTVDKKSKEARQLVRRVTFKLK